MRILLQLLSAVFLMGLVCFEAEATNYYNGYVQHGYTYYSPYWYYNNQPYTLSYSYYPSGYYGNSYYSSGYYPVYTLYTQPVAPKAEVPSYKDPGWKSKLLDAAINRDEERTYLEALKLLDINPGGVGIPSSAPGYNQNYDKLFANTYGGSTAVGYSVKTLLESYGENSLPLGLQAYSQAVEGLRKAHSDGVSGLGSTVDKLGSHQARVMEFLAASEQTRARGEAAAQALRAAQGSSSKVETTVTQSSSGVTTVVPVNPGVGKPEVPASAPKQRMPLADMEQTSAGLRWQAVAQVRCAGCHSGAKAAGKFDIAEYPSFDQSQKRVVRRRILSDDPAKAMPRDPATNQGYRLPDEEERALLGY